MKRNQNQVISTRPFCFQSVDGGGRGLPALRTRMIYWALVVMGRRGGPHWLIESEKVLVFNGGLCHHPDFSSRFWSGSYESLDWFKGKSTGTPL